MQGENKVIGKEVEKEEGKHLMHLTQCLSMFFVCVSLFFMFPDSFCSFFIEFRSCCYLFSNSHAVS